MSWKNWRTGLFGIASIVAGAAGAVNGLGNAETMTQSIGAILAGIGLLTAKDAQVTGGSIPSTPEAEKRVEKREKEELKVKLAEKEIK